MATCIQNHDNDNVGFIDTGFDITSLPNPYTQFNFLDFNHDISIYEV